MSIRSIFENYVLNEESDGPIKSVLLFPLYLLSLLFGFGTEVRRLLYRLGIFRSRSLTVPVISVGNITTGGTGKTPVALYLCAFLKERGYKVALLSRGYKGSIQEGVTVLSDGSTVFKGPEEVGDEPFMLASKLDGVVVITGRERFRTGSLAVEKYGVDIAVLDDGFQHRRLKRDVDILLTSPSTLRGRGFLLPRGNLREPLRGIERAHLIMVKDGKERPSHDKSPGRPVINFHYKPLSLIDLQRGDSEPVTLLKGKTVFAFCGTAFPGSFFNTLEELKCGEVIRSVFPDHHSYSDSDLDRIRESSSGADLIVTTEKDGVKLKKFDLRGMKIFALEIGVEVENEERFRTHLLKSLGR